MAINVNPPPLLRIPKAFLEDREVRSFIEQQNTIIFQLWNRSGGSADFSSQLIDDVDNLNNLTASNDTYLNKLRGISQKILKLSATNTQEINNLRQLMAAD